MVLLHIFGAVLAVVGLGLFVRSVLKGAHEDDAHMEAFKINVSGPSSLILIMFGILIFVFPFTDLFNNPTAPPPPSTIPTQATTTSTFGDATTTLVPEIGLPVTPINAVVGFDDECGEDALFWEQPEIDNVLGWWITLEAYTLDTDELFSSFEIDTAVDSTTFGNVTAICELDFTNDTPLLYWLWIYPYNDAGYADEPLFVEYLDD